MNQELKMYCSGSFFSLKIWLKNEVWWCRNVGKGEFKLADLSKWMAISAGSRALLGNLISDEDVSYLVQLDEGDAQGDALFSFVRI